MCEMPANSSENFDFRAGLENELLAIIGAVDEFDEALVGSMRDLLAHDGGNAVHADAITGSQVFNKKHTGHVGKVTACAVIA